MLANAWDSCELGQSKDGSTTCSESSLSGVETQPTKFIVIGNPGCGKSTLINCYVGEQLFTSGPSRNGSGVTYQLDEMCSKDGRKFLDTPGLSDVQMRKAAAEAIDKALQVGGVFKILFMVLETEGRWRSDDLTTMKLVIDATRGQISKDKYAILVNKCDEEFLQDLEDDSDLKKDTLATLFNSCEDRKMPTTCHILFAPMVSAMKRKHNMLMKLDPSVEKFLDALPVLNINKDEVDEVRHQEFEEMVELFAKAQEEAHEAKALAAAAQDEAKKAMASLESVTDEAHAAKALADKAQEEAKKAKASLESVKAELQDARSLQTYAQRLQVIVNKNRACIHTNTTHEVKLLLRKTSSKWLHLSSLTDIDVGSCIESCCGDLPREQVEEKFAAIIKDLVRVFQADFDCKSESEWATHLLASVAVGDGIQAAAHGLSVQTMKAGAVSGIGHFFVQEAVQALMTVASSRGATSCDDCGSPYLKKGDVIYGCSSCGMDLCDSCAKRHVAPRAPSGA
jgi:predicted GTPase